MLFISLLSFSASVGAVCVNSDFVKLKQILLCEIENTDDSITHWARMSFHDLHLQNNEGLHGCLINDAFLEVPGNDALAESTRRLFHLINENFPQGTLSFGDAIAFAGKIAFEYAFKGIDIPFKFGRNVCTQNTPTFGNASLPAGSIDSIAKLQPNLDYLGLTAMDMAILLAAGHGLEKAKADDSGFMGIFAHVHSGLDYIVKTFSLKWHPITTPKGEFQYYNKNIDTESDDGHIRTPSDILFYPSSIPDGYPKDPAAYPIENKLRAYTSQPSKVFYDDFTAVFAKMLDIDKGFIPFIDHKNETYYVCKHRNGGEVKDKNEAAAGKGGKHEQDGVSRDSCDSEDDILLVKSGTSADAVSVLLVIISVVFYNFI